MSSRPLLAVGAVASRRYFSSQASTIGFIGLGNMGLPMARNLLWKGGYSLVVCDTQVPGEIIRSKLLDNSSLPSNENQSPGSIKVVSTPDHVSRSASVVITMLPNNAAVESVYSDSGIFSNLSPGTLLVDSSTISPKLSQSMYQKAKKHSCDFLDAPVSGGVLGAEKATLAFMVGGDKEIYDKALPILSHMGKNIVYCGKSGLGQVAKICNNLLLAISMIGTSEVLHLGKRLGMDPKLLTSIINSSSGRCWSSDTYNPVPGVLPNVPSSNQYSGGFCVKLMCKDLGLALDAAKEADTNLPIGETAKQIYNTLKSTQDLHEKDFSVIYHFLENINTR